MLLLLLVIPYLFSSQFQCLGSKVERWSGGGERSTTTEDDNQTAAAARNHQYYSVHWEGFVAATTWFLVPTSDKLCPRSFSNLIFFKFFSYSRLRLFPHHRSIYAQQPVTTNKTHREEWKLKCNRSEVSMATRREGKGRGERIGWWSVTILIHIDRWWLQLVITSRDLNWLDRAFRRNPLPSLIYTGKLVHHPGNPFSLSSPSPLCPAIEARNSRSSTWIPPPFHHQCKKQQINRTGRQWSMTVVLNW